MTARILEGDVGQLFGGRVAKHGNTDEECQDASEILIDPDGRVRIALADGATQGSGQALWASLLVKAAARRSPRSAPTLREWLAPLQQEWSRLRAEAPVSANVPWFVSQTRFRGAGSTLLCVELERRGESLRWSAAAVGDSCVQIVSRSERRLMRSFPVERAEDFGVRPELLYTDNEAEVATLLVAEGDLAPGDLLITATDAVAKGLLADPRIVEEIADLDNEEAVVAFLQRLKQEDRVEDDDLTVVLFRAAPATSMRTQTESTPRKSDRVAQPAGSATMAPPRSRFVDADEGAAPSRRATAQTRSRPNNGEGIHTRRGSQSGILRNALITIIILILHDIGWYVLCTPAQKAPSPREVPPVSPREAVASTSLGDKAVENRKSALPATPPVSPRSAAVQPSTTAERKTVEGAAKDNNGGSMGLDASVAKPESWMCCSGDNRCMIKGNMAVVTAEDLNMRDAHGEKDGQVKPGRYEVLEKTPDRPTAWKAAPECGTWVRLGAEKYEKGSVHARP